MNQKKMTPLNKLKNQIAAVTGDEARPMLYALAAIAAAAVISVTVIRRKNKYKRAYRYRYQKDFIPLLRCHASG